MTTITAHINTLDAATLADLRRSGLSDDMITAMRIESLDVLQMRLRTNNDAAKADGYAIPYFDAQGKQIAHANHKCFQDSPKYIFMSGAVNHIYYPPGVAALLEQHDYLIVTEGEKKAARAVQDGLPCIALAGVWNWFDSESRAREKALGKRVSYETEVLEDLLKIAKSKRVILMFDSDIADKKGVRDALYALRDALLFNNAKWVRRVNIPVAGEGKTGLDDLLETTGGRAMLDAALHDARAMVTERMRHLVHFTYATASNGKPLAYYIPNSPIDCAENDCIMQEVEVDGVDGGPSKITAKKIASTRLWLNRGVRSIDGDDMVVGEYGLVPLDQDLPVYRTMTNDEAALNSGRGGSDPFTNLGARIKQGEKAAIMDFIHACLGHGRKSGAIKGVGGTTRRGWVRLPGGDYSYLSGNLISLLERDAKGQPVGAHTLQAHDERSPLVPMSVLDVDIQIANASTPAGTLDAWLQGIQPALEAPLPALMLAGSVAGMLRRWCPDSENFIFHIYGASSGGKSNALKAAASLWGDPDQLLDQWRATDNGLEGRCLARNDMALFLDEAGQAPNPDVLKNSAYLIGNGSEKARAAKDGSARKVRKFQLVALSTGEVALLGSEGHKAGQEVRVLDLPVDICGPLWAGAFADSAEAERFADFLKKNHGVAGRALIEKVLLMEARNPGRLAELHQRMTAMLRKYLPDGTPPHIVRRAKHYGLLMLGYSLLVSDAEGTPSVEHSKRFSTLLGIVGTKLLMTSGDTFGAGEEVSMFRDVMDAVSSATTHFQDGLVVRDNGSKPVVLGVLRGRMLNVTKPFFADMAKAGKFDMKRAINAMVAAGIQQVNGRDDTRGVFVDGATIRMVSIDLDQLKAACAYS